MKERKIIYHGDSLDIIFHVDRCTHVAECIRGAPEVFDTSRTPWILPDQAPADEIAKVIESCPTGALHYRRRDGGPEEKPFAENRVQVCRSGPLYLRGELEILDHERNIIVRDTRLALCRCGASSIPPLCDNAHYRASFREEEEFPSAEIKDESGRGCLRLHLTKNGPLRLEGPFRIEDEKGALLARGSKALLCRCGVSSTMPFCDGSHQRIGFRTPELIDLRKKAKTRPSRPKPDIEEIE